MALFDMLPCSPIADQADIGFAYPQNKGEFFTLKGGRSYQSNHIICNLGSRMLDSYGVYFQSKAMSANCVFAWGYVLKIRDVIIGLASVHMVYLKSPRRGSKKSGRNDAMNSNIFSAIRCVKARYQVTESVQLEASNAWVAMAINAMNGAYSSAIRRFVEPFPIGYGFPLFFHRLILARGAM